jgi:hypothetical protein
MDDEDVGMESLSEADFDFEEGSTSVSRPSSTAQDPIGTAGRDDLESDDEDYGEIKTLSQSILVVPPPTIAVASLSRETPARDHIDAEEDIASSAMIDSFATLGDSSAPTTPTRISSGVPVPHRSQTASSALTVRGVEDESTADGVDRAMEAVDKPADVGGSFHDITRPASEGTTAHDTDEQAVWVPVENAKGTPSELVLVEREVQHE